MAFRDNYDVDFSRLLKGESQVLLKPNDSDELTSNSSEEENNFCCFLFCLPFLRLKGVRNCCWQKRMYNVSIMLYSLRVEINNDAEERFEIPEQLALHFFRDSHSVFSNNIFWKYETVNNRSTMHGYMEFDIPHQVKINPTLFYNPAKDKYRKKYWNIMLLDKRTIKRVSRRFSETNRLLEDCDSVSDVLYNNVEQTIEPLAKLRLDIAPFVYQPNQLNGVLIKLHSTVPYIKSVSVRLAFLSELVWTNKKGYLPKTQVDLDHFKDSIIIDEKEHFEESSVINIEDFKFDQKEVVSTEEEMEFYQENMEPIPIPTKKQSELDIDRLLTLIEAREDQRKEEDPVFETNMTYRDIFDVYNDEVKLTEKDKKKYGLDIVTNPFALDFEQDKRMQTALLNEKVVEQVGQTFSPVQLENLYNNKNKLYDEYMNNEEENRFRLFVEKYNGLTDKRALIYEKFSGLKRYMPFLEAHEKDDYMEQKVFNHEIIQNSIILSEYFKIDTEPSKDDDAEAQQKFFEIIGSSYIPDSMSNSERLKNYETMEKLNNIALTIQKKSYETLHTDFRLISNEERYNDMSSLLQEWKQTLKQMEDCSNFGHTIHFSSRRRVYAYGLDKIIAELDHCMNLIRKRAQIAQKEQKEQNRDDEKLMDVLINEKIRMVDLKIAQEDRFLSCNKNRRKSSPKISDEPTFYNNNIFNDTGITLFKAIDETAKTTVSTFNKARETLKKKTNQYISKTLDMTRHFQNFN